MNNYVITGAQLLKLFEPSEDIKTHQYQINFEVCSETFITVHVNVEVALIVTTSVLSDFDVEQKSFVQDENGKVINDKKVRADNMYAWIASTLNKLFEGATKEEVRVTATSYRKVRTP